jgi:hypothetical protein
MRLIAGLLLTLTCFTSLAQLPDLLLKDKTGIYEHALDSVITSIKKERPLRVLYIESLECVSNYLPNTKQNVVIVTNKRKVKRKTNKLKTDELALTFACGQIFDNQVAVLIFTPQPSKWVFAFHYDSSLSLQEPRLLFVNRGPTTY